MTLTVMTGWSPSGWKEYGQRFAETFDRFWDADVRLVVCGEDPRELPNSSHRAWEFHPLTNIPGLVEFIEGHQHLNFHGRLKLPQHHWKERARAIGYNWRYDAVKFCRQAFIPEYVASMCRAGDHLAWLDGDVVTHARVSASDITDLLPADKSIAYLGRGAKHPEIGFQLYRVGTASRVMLAEFRRLYSSGEIFDLREWHSAYAWAEALKRTGGGLAEDLTPGGSGHVWHQSPLRGFTDHLKGDRKKSGRSPERRL